MIVPLSHKMPNGATVRDWLGTAVTASAICENELEGIRHHGGSLDDLHDARALALQVVTEIDTVIAEVELALIGAHRPDKATDEDES